jgi:ABC-2 type transport system permease protein
MCHDHRSIALVIVAPVMVMALVGFSFSDQVEMLNRIAPALIGTFALFFTFILTGVSFLRERTQGTLERLLVTPVGRGDILFGYLLGFIPFAAVQSAVILAFTVLVLPIHYQGALWQAAIVLLVLVIVAVNLGIFVSTFAKNEFQVVQFIPLVLAPQIFLSGIILPTDQMPSYSSSVRSGWAPRHHVERWRHIRYRGRNSSPLCICYRTVVACKSHTSPKLKTFHGNGSSWSLLLL